MQRGGGRVGVAVAVEECEPAVERGRVQVEGRHRTRQPATAAAATATAWTGESVLSQPLCDDSCGICGRSARTAAAAVRLARGPSARMDGVGLAREGPEAAEVVDLHAPKRVGPVAAADTSAAVSETGAFRCGGGPSSTQSRRQTEIRLHTRPAWLLSVCAAPRTGP